MTALIYRKTLILPFLCLVISALPVFAQDQAAARQDLWVSGVFDASFYSRFGAAFGGGAALGYGDGTAFGLTVIYSSDGDELKTVELNFFARFYLPRLTGHSGLFIQVSGGPVLFAQYSNLELPSALGSISAGLSLGWRFNLGRYFIIEPALRAGYPFIAALALSAGMHY